MGDRLKKEGRKEDLELMAKLTREIGAESVVAPPLTITIHTNVDPSKLGGTDPSERGGAFPYRLETRWWGRLRRTRRMCFSMIEIQAALDHFAPPVERVMDTAAQRRR